MKAPIPQGLAVSPSYFGILNNLMTLIICESLREIGEIACVTSAWSSRGQTLKPKEIEQSIVNKQSVVSHVICAMQIKRRVNSPTSSSMHC